MTDEIRPPDIKPRSKLWQRTYLELVRKGVNHNEAKHKADQAEKERTDEPPV